MARTTQYNVDFKYDLKGNAAKQLLGLKGHAQSANSSLGGLRSTMMLIGGGAMLHGAKKALIGFNSDIDKMKIGLSTVISMNLGKPFAEAQKSADKLFTNFQKMAIESPATTKNFVDMANQISSGVLMSGMGLKELESITKGAVIASTALGAPAEMMALDVTQMLQGKVTVRDRFARQLLAGVGYTDHEKFNKLKVPERNKVVTDAFNHSAIKKAAKAYETSFDGVTSTLKDNFELAMGKVGLPLFKAITEEVKSWNAWISKNPRTIQETVEKLGGMLKNAFLFIKDAASWLVEHKDTLLTIGKIFLVFKGAQMAQGLIRGFVGSLKSMSDTFKATKEAFATGLYGTNGIKTSLLSFAGGLVGALPAIAAFGAALFAAADWVANNMPNQLHDDKNKIATLKDARNALFDAENVAKRIQKIDEADKLTPELKTERDNLVAKFSDPEFVAPILKELDKLSGGKYRNKTPSEFLQYGLGIDTLHATEGARGAASQVLGYMGVADVNSKEGLELLRDVNITLAAMQTNMGVYEREAIFKAAFNEKFPEIEENGKPPGPPKVEVTINKIEVYSDDPDRFVHQAVESFEQITANPTAAREIMRGAF